MLYNAVCIWKLTLTVAVFIIYYFMNRQVYTDGENDQVDAETHAEESAHSILSPCHGLWQPSLAPLGSTESCLE